MAAALIVGCDGQRAGRGVDAAGAGATWRWRAERMEVSALTTASVDASGAPAVLDARIEFFDSEGDETKAVGALSIAVLLDGKPISAADSGDDVKNGVVTVKDQRLYRLVDVGKVETHTVTLRPAPGISAYAFTFG